MMKQKGHIPMKELDQLLDRDWDFDEMRDKVMMGTATEEEIAFIRSEAHRFDRAVKDLEQLRGKARAQSHDMGILMRCVRSWVHVI
jgi:hypothetical protein